MIGTKKDLKPVPEFFTPKEKKQIRNIRDIKLKELSDNHLEQLRYEVCKDSRKNDEPYMQAIEFERSLRICGRQPSPHNKTRCMLAFRSLAKYVIDNRVTLYTPTDGPEADDDNKRRTTV